MSEIAEGRGTEPERKAAGTDDGAGSDRPEEEIRPPSDEKALEWITALAAAGFDYWLSQAASGWAIHLPRESAAPARAEIEAYEADNKDWPPAPRAWSGPRPMSYGTWSSAWVCGMLVAFYGWLGAYRPEMPVLRLAAADTERILAGEWWRAITSLTLHASVPHLLGNVICLYFFGQAVCRTMGGGLGWALILGAGVAGNLSVAWALKADQVSVGASTSCFGALGILVACQVILKLRQAGGVRSIWDRPLIPLGAGLALLALLGTAPRSDFGAHAFGFIFGIVAAIPFGRFGTRWAPAWLQPVLQMTCIVVVMGAWRLVLKAAE